jgi:hypothetical protein
MARTLQIQLEDAIQFAMACGVEPMTLLGCAREQDPTKESFGIIWPLCLVSLSLLSSHCGDMV